MSSVLSRFFSLLAAASLVLGLLVGTLCARSGRGTDNLFFSGSGRLWWLMSDHGRLGIRTVRNWPGRQWPAWVAYRPGQDFGGPELWNYDVSDPPPTCSP